MSYQILTVADSPQIVLRAANDKHNALILPDLRDLLLLRARINAYLDTLQPDATTEAAPALPGEMISANQARDEAAKRGMPIEESALRMAMTRGTIPGAHKRGGRWFLPRHAFEEWLPGHYSRK